MIDDNIEDNLFTEEFQKVSKGKEKILLSDVLKMSILDENGDYKINLCHIHGDKDGKFTLKDFTKLSKISEEKEKEYKRFEFSAQLQAYFTLLMWKKVCSDEGEKDFVLWIKKLIINTSNTNKGNENQNEDENTSNNNDSEDDSINNINPDPTKYVDRNNLRILYDVLNVKDTHGIDFQSFFELMKITSDEMEEESYINEEFVLISVLDYFSLNFIRGFSKLILDLGFDSFMETEYDFEN